MTEQTTDAEDGDSEKGGADPWCENCGKSVFECECHTCSVCGGVEPDVELVLANGTATCRRCLSTDTHE